MRSRIVRGVILLLLVSITGCASTAGGDPAPATPPVGLRVGNTAPDFTLKSLEGDTVSLSDYRGQPILVNFWATWCGPCVIELPEMQETYETYRERGFVILAVDVQEGASRVQSFVDARGLTFPVLLDAEGQVAHSYRIRGLPTSYFVHSDGTILGTQIGPVDRAWIEVYLTKAGVTH